MNDPEAQRIIYALEAPEIYWLIKETGEGDALALLEMCRPEQQLFFLDMESWGKYEFLQTQFLEWLGYILEGGDEKFLNLLPHLDMELLTLFFMKTITVGGGLGDSVLNEEGTDEWDHSFDNLYYIKFRDEATSTQIGRLIDIIYKNNHSIYLGLMESVKSEIPSEVEEICYRFKTGRLADLGFPAYEDAVSIYARTDPDAYSIPNEKKCNIETGAENTNMPAALVEGSLLEKALQSAASEEIFFELNCLINTAIVAEGKVNQEAAAHHTVFERVHGYLNIALEFICGRDGIDASQLLERERLVKLFQVGGSIIRSLRQRASILFDKTDSLTYASNKALLGLKSDHPRFYRGLDPDMVDGFREFKNIHDVHKMEVLVDGLTGNCTD